MSEEVYLLVVAGRWEKASSTKESQGSGSSCPITKRVKKQWEVGLASPSQSLPKTFQKT